MTEHEFENCFVKVKKKPVVVEAFQWNGYCSGDVEKIMKNDHSIEFLGGRLRIGTREGWVTAYKGDWIIKGVKEELYPCGDEIFKETYTVHY